MAHSSADDLPFAEGPDGETPAEPSRSAQSSGRIASLDIIRGIAVMGILVANIISFGQPFGAYMWPDAFLTHHAATSDWLWVAQFVAVDGKMRGLFTLLFGAGMALFMDKEREGENSHALQLRRLAWLLLFGLAHFFFIWRGDILTLYALMGFIAVGFVRWEARNLLVLGLVGYVMGAVLYALAFATPHLIVDTSMGDAPEMAEMRESLKASAVSAGDDDAVETQILTGGSYADFVRHNFSAHGDEPIEQAFLFALETLPIMLIGMALFRLGLFSGGLPHARQRRWGWLGVIAGSLVTLLIALWIRSAGFTYWGTLAAFLAYSHLPRLLVVVGLAALLAMWGARADGWLAQRIACAGRVAFSNYLGTSIVMMLVFHPWAGGLWGQLTRPQLYLVAVLGCVAMLAWPKPWLRRFRYGPLEWLWRCLTYWRLLPMRRMAERA